MLAGVLTLGLAAGSVAAGTMAAQAATIPSAIDPASLKMTKVSGSSGPTLALFDVVRVDGKWSVPPGTVGGDTFSMKVPDELSQYTTGFDLLEADGSKMGTCTFTSGDGPTMMCTLNDSVNGRINVGGTFFFQLRASKVTTSTTGTFVIGNGPSVEVAYPGGGGIDQGSVSPLIFSKTVAYSPGGDSGYGRMLWQVNVPTANLPAGGVLKLHDALIPASGMLDGHHWSGTPTPRGASVQILGADGTSSNVPGSRISGGWDATGKILDMQVDLSNLSTGRGVRISYYTLPDDGNLIVGDRFGNSALVGERKLSATYTQAQTGGGTGPGDTVGRIRIAKAITGDAASQVPAGSSFQVAWSSTATAAGPAQSGTLIVPADGSPAQTPTLPRDAIVTLQELASTQISETRWGDAVFAGSGVVSVGSGTWTVPVTGGEITQVALTNTIAYKTYAVGDYTWIDANKNGLQDAGESVLPGVTVNLLDADGARLKTTTTDDKGFYLFDELRAGKYQVQFVLTDEQKQQYAFTTPLAGDIVSDSDAGEDGKSAVFMLDENDQHLTKDYSLQSVLASEGIDPTWDAGVVKIPVVTPTPTPTPTPTESLPPVTPSPSDTPSAPGVVPKGPAAPPSLAVTGGQDPTGLFAAAALLVAAGGALLLGAFMRRRATQTVAAGGDDADHDEQ